MQTNTNFISEESQTLIIEATAGNARHEFLQNLLSQHPESPERITALIDCDRYQYGPWAGLNQLLKIFLPEVQAKIPDLIIKHDYEITRILPDLRKMIRPRHLNLIDALPPDEPKLTYYPVDRIFRIIHGIVDLFKELHHHDKKVEWVILCDNYDQSSELVHAFFLELSRRLGETANITLFLAVSSGNGREWFDQFDSKKGKQFIRLDFPAEMESFSAQGMTKLAELMTAQIGNDLFEKEIHLPQLIKYWQKSTFPHKAIDEQINISRIYLDQGYYEDALLHVKNALDGVEQYYPGDQERSWNISENLHDCYMCLGRHEEAHLIIEKALKKAISPEHLFKGFYRMAMMDTRYLRDKQNLEEAEKYLNKGIEAIEQMQKTEQEKFYFKALCHRGLALIRHVQGRFEEAENICISTYDKNIDISGPDKYLGHQSLLQFNISRVYISMKRPEMSLVALSKAIEIDPNYSEYFNHRGNLFVTMDLHDNAVKDYLKAISLSPPYPEVWTNLAQCYRRLGEFHMAINSYTRSLEIDPNQVLALIGRAQSHEASGSIQLAIDDYTSSLNIDPQQPLVLANRAVLYYETELYLKSLSDLDQAISISPETGDLYQNRATVLISLNRISAAIQDLQTYLKYSPQAEDHLIVEEQIIKLQIDVDRELLHQS